MSYTSYLPAWSVGSDCYGDVYEVVRHFGGKAVVIGGETALKVAFEPLQKALAGEDLKLSGPFWYGGDATYENAAALAAKPEVQDADVIFAVGGGRAIDTCKVVAERLDKILFSFPTIASNCAPTTSLSVMYHADGTFKDYFYPRRPPVHCFIHSGILAEAPEEYLWAGIGDSLSKEYEVELASRGEKLFHTTLLGTTLAQACTDPLVDFGAKAMEQNRTGTPGHELEQVALSIVVSTGLASNLTVDPGQTYYYNSSLAHCVYYGATLVPESGGKHLHGEIVSYGVLTLLTYDGQFKERDRVMAFNHSIGLPVTLSEIGLAEGDLQTIADKASSVLEWTRAPYEVSKEAFKQAMLDADAAGQNYLKEQAALDTAS